MNIDDACDHKMFHLLLQNLTGINKTRVRRGKSDRKGKCVTQKKVRLYTTCVCYVIINQTSYTRVLSIV